MNTTHKGVKIFYKDSGKGETVVLLHGFLENSNMWDFIIPQISKTHRVICIDLLGHGNTACTGYIHTMEDMSAAVNSVINYLQIDSVSIIGHSMGGYVGCAFAKAYPEKLNALCLLNSSPLPDSQERKILRSRANIMAKSQYKQLIRMSFVNLFDSKTKERYHKEIALALEEALKTPVQGYIAANSGMRLRGDYSKTWLNGKFTKGMILGKDDWIIDSQLLKTRFNTSTNFLQIINGGHMSHIGQKKALIVLLIRFINQKM